MRVSTSVVCPDIKKYLIKNDKVSQLHESTDSCRLAVREKCGTNHGELYMKHTLSQKQTRDM